VEVLGEAGLNVQQRPIRDSEDQAAWLGATLQGLGLSRVPTWSVSFGSRLATNLALHDPGAAASLSLIDPASCSGASRSRSC
jgi:pimeloyl-ACP methyl ester carboxylesterase